MMHWAFMAIGIVLFFVARWQLLKWTDRLQQETREQRELYERIDDREEEWRKLRDKVAAQRRELRRLNEKIRSLHLPRTYKFFDELRTANVAHHEYNKMRKRAQAAEAELGRLRGAQLPELEER